jgi:hypothetical protein
MEHFTPTSAAIGGGLIGLSAILLWHCNGRIAGISGIVGGLFMPHAADVAWRGSFILGLICAPVLFGLVGGTPPKIEVSLPPLLIVAGGLLVGFGTRLGSGCTSGHGVCGMARLSRRSLAATVVFMGTAIVASFVLRHLAGA